MNPSVPSRNPLRWLVPAVGVVAACVALIVFGALFQVYIESNYCDVAKTDPALCSPWVPFYGSLFKALFVGIAAYALVSMDVDLIGYANKLKVAWITLAFVVIVALAAAIFAGQWEALVAATIGGIAAFSRIRRRLNAHGYRRSLGTSHMP